MKSLISASILLLVLTCISRPVLSQRIFDVHLHGSKDPALQMRALQKAGIYKAAISTSLDLQNSYRNIPNTHLLYGLMFPCPNGKVPYSLQPCYSNGEDWPAINWVEQQMTEGKIDYFGEILYQYYGISSSASLLFTYYRLAQKYNYRLVFTQEEPGPIMAAQTLKWRWVTLC